jgi:hypothetical protein
MTEMLWPTKKSLKLRWRRARQAWEQEVREKALMAGHRDGLRDPGALGVADGFVGGGTLRGEGDLDLAAVGWVRLAVDHGQFFQSGEDGAHGLGAHALGAGEVGGGGGSMDGEALEDASLGPGEILRSGCGAGAADEEADGGDEVGYGEFERFLRHRTRIADTQVNLQG